jgi:Rieske Fe-S protein
MSAAGGTLPNAAEAAALAARSYPRAKLVDEKRAPIRLAELRVGVNYVFDYPFSATPCFLLRLDRPAAGGVLLKTEAGETYKWEGGIGTDKSVVAYSAICAHKMTYPTRQVSFIGYRDAPSPVAGKGKVITCCSDRSVYDPSAGARVVSGPAPQPLATILLEHDPKTDEIFAVGTFGGEMFAEFFRKYEFRLQMEMGDRARTAVEGITVVRPLERFSTQWAQC